MTPGQSEQSWLALWRRLGASGNPGETYRELDARYTEPHRAYHTLAHIEHCLREFERVRDLARDPDAVELAIWFHDAIYDPRAKDNEEQSAALAVKTMREASLSRSIEKSVANLIMLTKHTAAPTETDGQLLVDIDLTILGQSASEFDEYERQICNEYEWVPEHQFIEGRSSVLNSFLSRPSIYASPFFQDLYETRARENLRRSLARLELRRSR